MKSAIKNYSLSWLTITIIGLFIILFRFLQIDSNELSWDVFGYYLYLPATFIHFDPLLHDIQWINVVNSKYHVADTLYMISSSPDGKPMYFFLMGTALLYLPFFLLGHGTAWLFEVPTDGFSWPYQTWMVIGGVCYTLIGLYFVRKVFRYFFSEQLSSILLLLMVFATNYIHHLTYKNLETVNILFMLVAIIIWNTIQWHTTFARKNLLAIISSICLIFLIKPTETLIVLFPLLYGVTNLDSFKSKLNTFKIYKKQFLSGLFIGAIILLPQVIYWYLLTGRPIYDSYKNPGVGLDLFQPHLIDILFSFRKGWFVYTPISIIGIWGFIRLYKENKGLFYPIFTYFITSFYIIASWSEWWYGAAFSVRPMIPLYSVLFIAIGMCLTHFKVWLIWKKVALAIFIALCLTLNLFQWWQFMHYIIDPYRTTPAYYWATFLKTSVSEKDKELLLVDRDFGGKDVFNSTKYHLTKNIKISPKSLVIQNQNEFLDFFELPYSQLTQKDHCWIKVRLQFEQLDTTEIKPCFVIQLQRKEGAYGYFAPEISSLQHKNGFYEFYYLTPNIRSTDDHVKCYLWNRNKKSQKISSIKTVIFERNQ